MSHELEIIDGEAQAMFERVAWHQLGTVVGKGFGWAEAIAADLSITWEVVKVPLGDLLTPFGSDADAPAPRAQEDEYVAFRPKDGLVIKSGHGEQWTPFPAVEGYAFGQCIREGALNAGLEADLLSLGQIDNGRKWFMTFNLGDFTIAGYKVADYLSVNGSYDGSWKLSVITSPIVQVCANTIAASRHSGVKHYSFKHTSGIFDRVEEAKRALIQHRENTEAFCALGNRLAAVRVPAVSYGKLLDSLFPVNDDVPTKTRNVNDEAQDKVTALYKAEVGPNVVQGVEGTGWAFVQAVNTYENWGTPIRKTAGRSEATTRALRQVEATVKGDQALTSKAIDLVLAGV